MLGHDVQHQLDGALREVELLRAENERLRTLLALTRQTEAIVTRSDRPPDRRPGAPASSEASTAEKLALIRRLFHGRDDL